uniref:Uncharacterized protein n=1 Tax=Lactuca sativa TaxID=4236 RepID=A0A9R1XVS7_LACSA|nr:hypothetical protein LSAT_V11C200059050 [Lactuca sativa]
MVGDDIQNKNKYKEGSNDLIKYISPTYIFPTIPNNDMSMKLHALDGRRHHGKRMVDHRYGEEYIEQHEEYTYDIGYVVGYK